jgi:hypothetical protein
VGENSQRLLQAAHVSAASMRWHVCGSIKVARCRPCCWLARRWFLVFSSSCRGCLCPGEGLPKHNATPPTPSLVRVAWRHRTRRVDERSPLLTDDARSATVRAARSARGSAASRPGTGLGASVSQAAAQKPAALSGINLPLTFLSSCRRDKNALHVCFVCAPYRATDFPPGVARRIAEHACPHRRAQQGRRKAVS